MSSNCAFNDKKQINTQTKHNKIKKQNVYSTAKKLINPVYKWTFKRSELLVMLVS